MNDVPLPPLARAIQLAFNGSIKMLIIIVWSSALLFGLYILTFYVAAFEQDEMMKWNENLPGLYQADEPVATSGIGVHFAAGGLILILGSIQLIGSLRQRFPTFHRWVGRIYVSACLLTAIGGLIFIVINGTIGGIVMDIGFGLYGILMIVSAIQAFLYARTGSFQQHRAWAIRLYTLAIGSWLYRMDYGFWAILADSAGHSDNFQGPFDYVMDFFFYIPSLMVAEVFIRRKNSDLSLGVKSLVSVTFLVVSCFIGIGTYYFTRYYWGPSIIAFVG